MISAALGQRAFTVPSPDDDFSQLLLAARTNADWAWRALYVEHAPIVLQFLRARGASDAEDLLGEVFIDVVRSIATFSGNAEQFRSWVFRIAQNRFLDERRRHGRTPAHTGIEFLHHHVEDGQPTTEALVLQEAAEHRLLRLLGILPDDQRAAVYLRVVLEHQPAEIAVIMDRPVGSVKMLITRGLASLRERFGDVFELP